MLKPAAKAPFAVISDIDDTILVSGLTEGLTALKQTLLRDANTRSAVRGMASLYRGLTRGVPGPSGARKPSPAFFYVSTGSWSFYEMLQQFIQLRPSRVPCSSPSGARLSAMCAGAEHKRMAIRRLFQAYPDTDFVLIGDSGQRDALTYEGDGPRVSRPCETHPHPAGGIGQGRSATSELSKRTPQLFAVRESRCTWSPDAAHAADLAHAPGAV